MKGEGAAYCGDAYHCLCQFH